MRSRLGETMGKPRRQDEACIRELAIGDVPDGWTPLGWIGHLEHMIEACEGVRPDKAEEYRRWIATIEERRTEK